MGAGRVLRTRALALETQQPEETVRSVYESEFRRLDADARIETYLPIFAARNARKILTGH